MCVGGWVGGGGGWSLNQLESLCFILVDTLTRLKPAISLSCRTVGVDRLTLVNQGQNTGG